MNRIYGYLIAIAILLFLICFPKYSHYLVYSLAAGSFVVVAINHRRIYQQFKDEAEKPKATDLYGYIVIFLVLAGVFWLGKAMLK